MDTPEISTTPTLPNPTPQKPRRFNRLRKKSTLMYAIPIVLVVILVGAYVIYRSFAAVSTSCPPTTTDVEQCTTTSDEAKIARLYYTIMGRTPDQAGLYYWVSQLQNGKTLLSIAKSFLGTPEFRARYGANSTNKEFITKLYQNMFNREPSNADLIYWENQLTGTANATATSTSTTVAKTREAVVLGFTESPEMRNKFKTQVAQILKIDMTKLGSYLKTYASSEIVCYGKKQVTDGRAECAIEPKGVDAALTKEKAFIAGGANWGIGGTKTGQSYTVCADVRAKPPTSPTVVQTSASTQSTTPVVKDVFSQVASSHAPVSAQPQGKLLVGIAGRQNLLFSPIGTYSKYKTVCHDLTDMADNAQGWYLQLGLSLGVDSNSSTSVGTVAFALNSVRLYQVDKNLASARTQNAAYLQEFPTNDSGPLASRDAVLPPPYSSKATPWAAKKSGKTMYYRVSEQSQQPVWKSQHLGYAGENKLTSIKFSPLGTSSNEVQIEYIIKDAKGNRVPVYRFVIIDPVTGFEIKRFNTEPGNSSKIILTSGDLSSAGLAGANITPIFLQSGAGGRLSVQVKIYKGHLDFGEGVRVEPYHRVGPIISKLVINANEPTFAKIPSIRIDDSPPGAHTPSNCTGTFTPGAAALRAFIANQWPAVPAIGGYDCRAIVGGSGTSIHGLGRAIDIGIGDQNDSVPPDSKEIAYGNQIRNVLYNNATLLGLQRIIWNNHIWSADKDGWREYTGENNHYGHLHVEINLTTSSNFDLTGVWP